MSHLKLITNNLSYEERIQARIDSFYREMLLGEGDIELAYKTMCVIHDYLAEFEDPEIVESCFKVKEAIFFIAHWLDD